MNKLFDKSKIYNYIVASIFFFTAVLFIKNMAMFIWKFDIFNMKQLVNFFKHILSGKIFNSGKQLSFLITFIGAVCITIGGILISMKLKFIKEENANNENSDNLENTSSETATDIKKEKVIEKSPENTNTNNIISENTALKTPSEEKYAVYNNPVKSEEIKTEEPIITKNTNNLENEDEERAKLQAKIKEIMKKMKEKQSLEENIKEEEVVSKTNTKKEDNKEKSVEKIEFKNPENFKIDMNFKNISDEENMQMEHTLISAGFKLLSEIRIGSTGIDYLGVAKDKFTIIQFDTTSGNWFASEDKVEGNQAPVWFSESGNKISPVSRVLEAKSDILKLLGDKIKKPIDTIVCLSNNDIVNYSEWVEKWNEMGVKVVKLNENEGDNISGIKTLSSVYPVHSQKEIDEKSMNEVISILEKAEIPE